MERIKEKVAYLHGLAKGLNVNDNSPDGKVMLNIIDVLDSMAEEIQYIQDAQQDLESYVETIDEDLTDLEEEVYEEEGFEDSVEVECPVCHEVVNFEANVLNEDDAVEVTCPNCGGIVYENTIDLELDDNSAVDYERGTHPGV